MEVEFQRDSRRDETSITHRQMASIESHYRLAETTRIAQDVIVERRAGIEQLRGLQTKMDAAETRGSLCLFDAFIRSKSTHRT
jgi:hypothetical protein